MTAPLPVFLTRDDLKLMMFAGKGGVGKTTCAVSSAIHIAVRRPTHSCLLVSTDPAHSLQDSLADFQIPGNLTVLELDSRACLDRYRDEHIGNLREIARRGTFLDDEDINQLTDLSLPGMDELMALLEISSWTHSRDYDLIIVDTAPTGHTLRLLGVPLLLRQWLDALDTLLGKYRYMKKHFTRVYRSDDVDKYLLGELKTLSRMEALLHDTARCCLIPVTLAESMVLEETSRFLVRLRKLKIPFDTLIVNRLYPRNDCPLCNRIRRSQFHELDRASALFSDHQVWALPMLPAEVRGQEALVTFWSNVTVLDSSSFTSSADVSLRDGFVAATGAATGASPAPESGATPAPASVVAPAPESGATPAPKAVAAPAPKAVAAPAPESGATPEIDISQGSFRVDCPPPEPSSHLDLLIFGGKGGVGKTTLACATAIRLAQHPYRRVLLFSTDPAHSLSDCFETDVGGAPREIMSRLHAMEVDADREFETLKGEYSDELETVLSSLLKNLDLTFDEEVMKRLLDLAPPGIDEVMALTIAMDLLRRGDFNLLILDSAPTGHLLRLLEMPELMESWLKTVFEVLLKYRAILRLPRVTQRLIDVSKNLKALRRLILDPTRAALYGVGILTRMSLEETHDLVTACVRSRLNYPVHFHNLVTEAPECGLCQAIAEQEALLFAEASLASQTRHSSLVYRGQRPVGVRRLEALGEALYGAMGEVAEDGNKEKTDEQVIAQAG